MVRKRTAWVLVAGVAALALGAAAVGVLAVILRGQSGPAWSGNSYLFLDLADEIPEQPPSELGSFFERRPPSLRTLVESVDRAAADPKVTALMLRVSFLPDAGWGKVQELRDAVSRFRERGKPAYAYVEFCGNKEYYLATAADKIYALPTALLDVTGLAAEVTFLRRTLDKLEHCLRQVIDRDTGEPVVDEIVRIQDAYQGTRVHALPDMFALWNRRSPIKSIRSPWFDKITLQPRSVTDTRSGDHVCEAEMITNFDPPFGKGPIPVQDIASGLIGLLI